MLPMIRKGFTGRFHSGRCADVWPYVGVPALPYRIARTALPTIHVLRCRPTLIVSSALSDRNHRRAQNLFANAVAWPDDADDPVLVLIGGDRNSGDGLVQCGVERLVHGVEGPDAEALEPAEELRPDEPHSLQERLDGLGGCGCVERAIEVVEHFEELSEHRAFAAINFLDDLT